jgi:hypothetical protein
MPTVHTQCSVAWTVPHYRVALHIILVPRGNDADSAHQLLLPTSHNLVMALCNAISVCCGMDKYLIVAPHIILLTHTATATHITAK